MILYIYNHLHRDIFIKVEITKEQLKLLSIELSDDDYIDSNCKKFVIFLHILAKTF